MITRRSIAISLILIASLSVCTIYAEHFVGSINSISPPPGAIFLFFIVVLINSLFRTQKLNLQRSELVLVYSLLLVAAPISSFAITRFFLSILVAPFYFATPENEFAALFHSIIPEWFAPSTPSVVRGYYEPLGKGLPWEAWIRPLLVWIPVVLVAYTLMLCMSIIIHKQWIDRERLTFPTVYLPLQLSEEPEQDSLLNSFLKNRILWIGFAIPVLIHGINGLSFHYPVIPSLPLKGSFARFFTDVPWNAIDQLPINFYPNVIGFTYLLPVEISFSCWFFYLLSKLGMVIGAAFGWRITTSSGGRFPFPHYQSAGAFIALIIFSLWFGRRHIVSSFAMVFKLGRFPNVEQTKLDRDTVKVYRFAFIGFITALFVLAIWFSYIGMKPIVIVGFLALFLVYSLSAGRVRTEAGLGAVSGPIRMDNLLKLTIGTRNVGPQNLTMLAYLRWMTIDMRGFMSAVPAQLESFRMAGASSESIKRMPVLMLSSVTLALIISCVSLLWVSYEHGAYTSGVNGWWMVAGPRETFNILRQNMLNLQGTDWTGVEFMSIGFALSGAILYLRTRFLWFPFHPLGYAVGFSRLSMDWVWFSVLIGWILKLSVMKYGGIKLNRKFVPLSLGLVLGDFFMAGFWSIVGAIGDRIVYQIFP